MTQNKSYKDANILVIVGLRTEKIFACTVNSLFNINKPKGLKIMFESGSYYPYVLNKMVKNYKKFDAVLILEWDHEFNRYTLERLWNDNKPVVCGLYRSRNHVKHAYLIADDFPYKYIEPKSMEELFDVDNTGTGFMLIRKEVFDKLPEPFFTDNVEESLGVDVCFSRSLRKNGFKIWIDPKVRIGHVVNQVIY